LKTVTDAFKSTQKRDATFIWFRIFYKRRFWDAGTTSFIYETEYRELNRDQINFVDPILHQFDSVTLNEFKVSNVILRLRNDLMQWKEGSHDASLLKPDGASSFGYEPFLQKFQIRAGFKNVGGADPRIDSTVKPGGSEELIVIFTGVATDWVFDTKSRTVQVAVEGLERLMLDSDAQSVSNLITSEILGTTDGDNFEFFTENNGVGEITEVKLDAKVLRRGIDFNVADLDVFELPARITLVETPTSGKSIICTYRFWKRNQPVEDLITDLLAETIIPTTSIDDATLGTIKNNISLNSKADFGAAVLNTGLEKGTEPGKLKINFGLSTSKQLFNDFAGGFPTDGTNGYVGITVSAAVSYDIVAGELKAFGDNTGTDKFARLRKSYTTVIGVGDWEFDVRFEIFDGTSFLELWFMANSDTADAHDGYFIRIGVGLLGVNDLFLMKKDSGSTTGTILANVFTSVDWTVTKTVRVARDMTGTFTVYIDNVKFLFVSDETWEFGDRLVINTSIGGVTKEIFLDNIKVPAFSIATVHQSKTIDTVSGLTAWGNLTVDFTKPVGATITFETRTSTDDITYDAFVAVSATNGILSAVKRFIQVRISLTFSTNTYRQIQYEIVEETVEFTSDKVFVAMANFSEKNVHDSVKELAKFTDFEWGLNDDEDFFFRSRDVTSVPDDTFAQNTNLAQVLFLKEGIDRVFSIVRAFFGSFFAEVASPADVRTSALEVFGTRVLQVSSNILINKDTNISDNIALVFHTRLSVKRKNLRIKTKFWPQIELSDTLSVTFNQDASGVQEPLITALICKVIGTRHDIENASSEFELEEIV